MTDAPIPLHPGRAAPPAPAVPTMADRIRTLMDDARDLAADDSRAFVSLLGMVCEHAADIAMSEVHPPGVVNVARQIASTWPTEVQALRAVLARGRR